MNLTIHFSPAYDKGCYLNDPETGKMTFGEKYVGASGFLEEIELRAGLTSRKPKAYEQLAQYCAAAKEATASGGTFFTASLNVSPLATAGELLRWRNELVFSGWTQESSLPDGLTKGGHNILAGIAAVEKKLPAGFRTDADRWRAVISDAPEDKFMDGIQIIVHVPEKHLHPTYRKVLNVLKEHGAKVSHIEDSAIPDTETLRFHDSVDAYLWAAATNGGELVICSDRCSLAEAAKALGKPDCGCSGKSVGRPAEHLFVSAMMLLADGANPDALRDYLSSPVHPLNKFKVKDGELELHLRKELLDHIVAQNGTGKSHITGRTFDETIVHYAGGDAEKEKEIKELIPAAGEKLTFDRVDAMCRNLTNWCDRMLNTDSADFSEKWSGHIRAVENSCEAMTFMLKESGLDKKTKIPENDFMNALKYASTPQESELGRTGIGSFPVTSGPETIAVDVNDAVWVDPSQSNSLFGLSFLCDSDIDTLKEKARLDMQTMAEAIESEDACLRTGLAHVKGKLKMLACDAFSGKKFQRHPALIEAAAAKATAGKALDWLDRLTYTDIPEDMAKNQAVASPNTQQFEYKDLEGLKEATLPDHESPSSLELLFDRPFDHIVANILRLRDENNSKTSTIMGSVAHETIHRLYERAATGKTDVCPDEFQAAFKNYFDADFNASVMSCGMKLTLPENRVQYKQLRHILSTRSIPKLIETLKCSGMSIAGSEIECKNIDISISGKAPLVLTATIDMLLRNSSGHWFILDFKWTSGKTGLDMRTNQIKKGEDYQLALYRYLCEKGTPEIPAGTVDGQAFYMLKTAEFLTAYPGLKDTGGDIAVISGTTKTYQKEYSETIAEIHDKYTRFVNDLRDGKVKEGEGMTSPDGKEIKDNSYGENVILKGKLK